MKNTFLQPTDFQPQLRRLVQLEHEQPDSIKMFEFGEIGKFKDYLGNNKDYLGNSRDYLGNSRDYFGNRKDYLRN